MGQRRLIGSSTGCDRSKHFLVSANFLTAGNASRAPVLVVFTHWDKLKKREAAEFLLNWPASKLLDGLNLEVEGPFCVSNKTMLGINELRSTIESVARDLNRFPAIPAYYENIQARLSNVQTDQFGRIPSDEAENIGSDVNRTRNALHYLEHHFSYQTIHSLLCLHLSLHFFLLQQLKGVHHLQVRGEVEIASKKQKSNKLFNDTGSTT